MARAMLRPPTVGRQRATPPARPAPPCVAIPGASLYPLVIDAPRPGHDVLAFLRSLKRRAIPGAAALMLGGLLWALAGPAALADTAPKRARFMPVWYPQAQFAGFLVALDKGFYRRQGIELELVPASAARSALDALASGEVDFAVGWLTSAIQRREHGVPLVNLAQVIQRSSMMLVAMKSSGIQSVADMAGRKVGLWSGDLSIPPRALFARLGIEVVEVPQSYTVNLFLRGGIDVASAMWFNEYHTIIESGVDPEELSAFLLSEQGVNFPEDGLYALETTVQRDPALVEAFTTASLEGWRYAFDHPEEALDIVLAHMRGANLPANRVHQKWMLERMRDLMQPDDPQGEWGRLGAADYASVLASMREAGLVEAPPDFEAFVRGGDARAH